MAQNAKKPSAQRRSAQDDGAQPAAASETAEAEAGPSDAGPSEAGPEGLARDYLDLWQRQLTAMLSGGEASRALVPALQMLQAWTIAAATPPATGSFAAGPIADGTAVGGAAGTPWWLAPWAATGAPFTGPFPSSPAATNHDSARGRDEGNQPAGAASAAAAPVSGQPALGDVARRLANLERRLDDIAATLERLERAGGGKRSGGAGRRPRS
ncbi:MAG: hypothetical protein RLO50_05305 [Azospirillaceae bacterium]